MMRVQIQLPDELYQRAKEFAAQRVLSLAEVTRRGLELFLDRLAMSLDGRPGKRRSIRGSGGLRKLRWGGSGRGKRGGLRVIYYWRVPGSTILMLLAYPKNEQDNLSSAQLKFLKTIIETEYP